MAGRGSTIDARTRGSEVTCGSPRQFAPTLSEARPSCEARQLGGSNPQWLGTPRSAKSALDPVHASGETRAHRTEVLPRSKRADTARPVNRPDCSTIVGDRRRNWHVAAGSTSMSCAESALPCTVRERSPTSVCSGRLPSSDSSRKPLSFCQWWTDADPALGWVSRSNPVGDAGSAWPLAEG